jgi:hypothetical protein
MSGIENATQEMRSHNRVEVSEVIRVVNRQTGTDLGQLVNISEEGFMLLGSQPIAEDNILQLSLEFEAAAVNTSPILIGVECLWCHASNDQTQYWAGFYIIDISDVDLERVRDLTG